MELISSIFECFCFNSNSKHANNEVILSSLDVDSNDHSQNNFRNNKTNSLKRRTSEEIRKYLDDIKNEPGMKEILNYKVTLSKSSSKYPYPPSSDPFKYVSEEMIARYEKEYNVKVNRNISN